MTTVVDARIPAEELALERTLEQNPDARFEIFRMVANTTDDVVPYLWGSGASREDLASSLRSDPTIRDVEVVSEFDDEYLFRMAWMANLELLYNVVLTEDESALLDASCSDGDWWLRLVFPDSSCVRSMCQQCEDMELTASVERVYPLTGSIKRDQFQLTEKQFETVTAAYEAGYYEVPREVTLTELAEELDLSHQALSERLRRAHEALIANGLGVDSEGSVVIDAGPENGINRPPLAQRRSH